MYGKVLEIKIPRPVWNERIVEHGIEDENKVEDQEDKVTNKKAVKPEEDPNNYDYPQGFSSAFVEFTSINEAKRARKYINLLKYAGRIVECEYFDEEKFERGDLSSEEVQKREKMGLEFEGLENCAIEFTEPRIS